MSFQVIPAIDLIGGEVVRLVRGDYDAKTVYHADPVALSVSFAQAGVQRLHVVDLEGAKAGSPVHDSLIQRMVAASGLAIEVGGGIRDMATAAQYLDGAGVQWVILGTAAVRDPDFVRRACARWPDRILVGLDVRNGLVAVDGWLKESSSTAEGIASAYAQAGVAGIIYTDIQRDGTGDGPNVEATAALAEHAGVPIIASGGVATLDHIAAIRRESVRGIAGVVVGKAILSGDLSVEEALGAVD